jgi:hypothetical protein
MEGMGVDDGAAAKAIGLPHLRIDYGPSRSVRQLLVLAKQYMRWELNDSPRRLDEQPAAVELRDALVPAPASSLTGLTAYGRRTPRRPASCRRTSGRSSTWCASRG